MSGSKTKEAVGNGCTLYKKCGGCQLQNMDYERQLRFKQATVVKLIGKYCRVGDIIGMDEPYHYRHKVQAGFAKVGGSVISGVYQSSTHRIVKVDACPIENERADSIIVTIRRLIHEFKLSIYSDKTPKGVMCHCLVRVGYHSGEIMVVLVTAAREFPKKHDFISKLTMLHPEITTVVQSIGKSTTLALGREFVTLYGKGYINDTLCGCNFKISPGAFYQVNPKQTEILYSTAIDFMGLGGDETVIDAYCGTGTITLCLAREAGRAVGVEVVPQAIDDAKENAVRNGLADKTEFYCMDAGQAAQMFAAKGERPDVIVVDPPRKGVSPDVIEAMAAMGPRRIVYVSCDPATLARDVKLLRERGYALQTAEAVDLFPRCAHIETVCLLSRQEGA